jgi:DNA-binding transcriptional LysR family regulator
LIRRLAFFDQGIVAEDVVQGRLQRIFPDWAGLSIPVFAMTEMRLSPAKTQRFIEFLREQLADSDRRRH